MTKNDDGWYEGVIEPGIRGLFPVSYIIENMLFIFLFRILGKLC